MKVPHPSVRRRLASAFTLVEMMVVVAIIAIMLAVAGAIFNTGDGRDAVRAAAREVQGLVETARGRALSSGNQTALLIFHKPDDERFLRFLLVVERRPKDDTKPDEGFEWIPVDNGRLLADGAFYWPKEEVAFKEPFGAEGELKLGKSFEQFSKEDWIGLIFTPQGFPAAKGPLQQNPIFLISRGEISSSGLDVSEADKLQCEAFMIQRSNGRIVPVESPVEQLTL